jgi:hypothetical protein
MATTTPPCHAKVIALFACGSDRHAPTLAKAPTASAASAAVCLLFAGLVGRGKRMGELGADERT